MYLLPSYINIYFWIKSKAGKRFVGLVYFYVICSHRLWKPATPVETQVRCQRFNSNSPIGIPVVGEKQHRSCITPALLPRSIWLIHAETDLSHGPVHKQKRQTIKDSTQQTTHTILQCCKPVTTCYVVNKTLLSQKTQAIHLDVGAVRITYFPSVS